MEGMLFLLEMSKWFLCGSVWVISPYLAITRTPLNSNNEFLGLGWHLLGLDQSAFCIWPVAQNTTWDCYDAGTTPHHNTFLLVRHLYIQRHRTFEKRCTVLLQAKYCVRFTLDTDLVRKGSSSHRCLPFEIHYILCSNTERYQTYQCAFDSPLYPCLFAAMAYCTKLTQDQTTHCIHQGWDPCGGTPEIHWCWCASSWEALCWFIDTQCRGWKCGHEITLACSTGWLFGTR